MPPEIGGQTNMEPTFDKRLEAFGQSLEQRPGLAAIRELATVFPDCGIYAVGGIVRDVQLDREAKDYDFVVRGIPAEDLKMFLETRGVVNIVGRNFGVFKFQPTAWQGSTEFIDIALPRTEHAEGTGGYRDFDVQANPDLDITDDLSRRDFTINAMAWDVRNHALVDPFGGRADLEAKLIRAVRDPNERLTEDRSRMLRGLRFAAQLGFDIAPETMAAIQALMPKINEQRPTRKAHEQTTLIRDVEYVTPRETIAKEMIKSFVADPVRSLDLWDEAGAIEQLMPELLAMKDCEQPVEFHSEGDVWKHTRLALEKLRSPAYREAFGDEKPSALVVLAILLHDVGKPPMKRTPEQDGTDRVRFDRHNEVGGTIARDIAKRLALAAPFPELQPDGAPHPLHIDPDQLGWIIDNHLLLLQDPTGMRNATIEKYFFNPQKPGDALQRVSFCDGSAAILASGEADLAHFRALRARIADLGAFIQERNRLPPPVLDGRTIMESFHLKPGMHLHFLIEAIREEQLRILTLEHGELTRDAAIAFLAPLVERMQQVAPIFSDADLDGFGISKQRDRFATQEAIRREQLRILFMEQRDMTDDEARALLANRLAQRSART